MKECYVLKPFDGHKVGEVIEVDEINLSRWERTDRVTPVDTVQDNPEFLDRIEKLKRIRPPLSGPSRDRVVAMLRPYYDARKDEAEKQSREAEKERLEKKQTRDDVAAIRADLQHLKESNPENDSENRSKDLSMMRMFADPHLLHEYVDSKMSEMSYPKIWNHLYEMADRLNLRKRPTSPESLKNSHYAWRKKMAKK